uniref:Glycogen debranching enzymye n=1 Tax=Ganoderma boninense TaxID=34458 RepID=A0A5K1JS15_9APHY|nr:Glycogen debranching enzymye [Ganoderma boninense]
MGYRQAAVLVSVSFFLGEFLPLILTVYPLKCPTAIDPFITPPYADAQTIASLDPKALLHGIVILGLVGLIGKLHKWDESAVFFDGSSLAAYIFALAVYMTVGIPACRTVADPVPNVDTKDDQIEALRILSAGNTIIIVLLGGILALQAGQQWARRLEDNAAAEAATEKTKAAVPEKKAGAAAESKKDK